MKILKEEKEQLPISFITEFVSGGWTTVGTLKEEIKSIKETFNNTEKIEKVLQDLIDSYLICIGQLELYLHNNNYVELPVEKTGEVEVEVEKPIVVEPEIKIEAEDIKPEDTDTDCFNCDFEEPELTAEDKANYEESTKVL